VCGWQVKLCDPFITHGPYLSTLAMELTHDKALNKSPDYSYSKAYVMTQVHLTADTNQFICHK